MDTWWPKGKRFARLEKVIFIFIFIFLTWFLRHNSRRSCSLSVFFSSSPLSIYLWLSMFVFRFFFVLFATRESKQQRNRRSRERGVFLLGMNVYRTQNQRADGLIEGQGEAVMPVVFFFFSPLETRQPSESENRQQQNA
jgi:hypothetical protein